MEQGTIEEVQIFATETIGCEGRSQYLMKPQVSSETCASAESRLLQILGTDDCMDGWLPCRMDAREIRREKTKVLSATRLGEKLICGQYDSYRSEEGR